MFQEIRSAIRPALVMTALFAALLGLVYPAAMTLFAALLGLVYPAAMTGLGQLAFPYQANGSLIRENGKVIGSELLAQRFESPRYFHPRPSAAGKGYEADNSYGSNLGPTSQALHDRIAADIKILRPSPDVIVPPADLVTTSASGLDPHISPEAAFFQVDRVAQARDMPAETVRNLVEASIEKPLLGFLGEPRVNVLMLNRTLDRQDRAGAQTGA